MKWVSVMEVKDYFKYLLTRAGASLSPNIITTLNATVNYLEVGRWMHELGYDA
jgi:hypothetical protein